MATASPLPPGDGSTGETRQAAAACDNVSRHTIRRSADLQAVLRRGKRDLAAAETAVASLLAPLPTENQPP
jgi:hypothetical protein